MKKINVENKINKYYVITGTICIVILGVLLVFSMTKNAKQYLVQKGNLEYTEITTAYIVKDEITVSKDKTKVLVPVLAEGSRISKNDIIATYKGEEYKNYEENLSKMDKEILERMQELPAVYSSEVDAIENTIYMLLKDSIGETSYNKMQEYKQKINTNIKKRANIIGTLSPDGAQIKKLIEKRNKYEAEAKSSNDNILAPMGGIVSYVSDGLEDKIDYSNIKKTSYNAIKDTVNDQKQSDNTKIKIVNNYEAYIIIKADLKNIEYMEEGYDYRIRLIEQDNYELLGCLEKMNKTDDGVEVYFKITNGIEHIVNLRQTEVEIIWDHSTGLIVPTEALNKYNNLDANYIKVIKYGEYVNIPVQVRIENENYILVKDYADEQLEEFGLTDSYSLKLYDRIIVESNK